MKLSPKTRATIGGLCIALGSLYALSLSYNIPGAELLWFLMGSALVLVAAIIAAALLVVLVKLLTGLWRRVLRTRHDDDAG